jgi:hypothetical protein
VLFSSLFFSFHILPGCASVHGLTVRLHQAVKHGAELGPRQGGKWLATFGVINLRLARTPRRKSMMEILHLVELEYFKSCLICMLFFLFLLFLV